MDDDEDWVNAPVQQPSSSKPPPKPSVDADDDMFDDVDEEALAQIYSSPAKPPSQPALFLRSGSDEEM